MGIPLRQQMAMGAYIAKQWLAGRRRYPLVLMLEPLFRCNLACPGCGKIDYPNAILNRRLSPEDCWSAAEECGAPMVAIPGGEPLIHKEIDQIVSGLVARRKYVSLCTNALLLEKKLGLFEPSPYLFFSVHLDGLKPSHDHAVDRAGVFDRAVQAIKATQAAGHRVAVNATVFEGGTAEGFADFLDYAAALGTSVSLSPGFSYERAPDQDSFLVRHRTKAFFREVWAIGRARRSRWDISQSPLFMDFLMGNRQMRCSPWGMPTRNVFGWQRPCYLLGEGYAASFQELMEETNWDSYGTGAYEKCTNCMAHCGYEPTAAQIAFTNPLSMLSLSLKGPKTSGPMAPEVDVANARAAEEHHSRIVATSLPRAS
ncbi:MAG: adenosyl-hopene transferase HpnH [Pseudomonadota bacterium]